MKIAISGAKGGSGKTWLATNLACTLLTKGQEVSFLDTDVEEPNAHLFLKPEIERTERVNVLVPKVNGSLCDGCGECHRFCAFNAILPLGSETLVFHELCHGCGGCAMVCPKNAIKEVPLAIGTVSEGRRGSLTFAMGTLDIGYPRPGPVIEAVQKKAKASSLTIIDTPPGTSCPVVQALSGVSFVLAILEATPFGLSDFRLALKMLERLNVPFGVVLNRLLPSSGREAMDTLYDMRIEPMAAFNEDVRIAKAYAEGRLAIEAVPGIGQAFERLAQGLLARVS